jgi:hypothetical protein
MLLRCLYCLSKIPILHIVLPYQERQRDWPDDARQPLFLNSMVPHPTERVSSER